MRNIFACRNIFGCIGLFLLFTETPDAQEQMRYRDFELGSSLRTVAALTSAQPSQAKIIHQRPAVIQELEWRPRYYSSNGAPASDPVAVVTFNFFNDQLFRIVIDYDRHRTAGMTESDLIEAVTNTYGQASKPTAGMNATLPARYGVPDTPVAIWGDAENVVTLLRVAYPETFRLVLAHTRLEHLARAAAVEAARLDVEEAPQRELARRKKEVDETDAAREKSRIENKAVFKP